jgi:hypothetical protein
METLNKDACAAGMEAGRASSLYRSVRRELVERYTDCTALLAGDGAEDVGGVLAIKKAPRELKEYGGALVSVSAPDETGAMKPPMFRLEGVVLPYNVSKWDKLAVPAGAGTALGGLVARFERGAQKHAETHFAKPGAEPPQVKSALRETPAGVVLDVKLGECPGWFVEGRAVQRADVGPLARHKADLVLGVDGLWLRGDELTTRWRLLSCADLGPAAPQFDNSEYAFLDAN